MIKIKFDIDEYSNWYSTNDIEYTNDDNIKIDYKKIYFILKKSDLLYSKNKIRIDISYNTFYIYEYLREYNCTVDTIIDNNLSNGKLVNFRVFYDHNFAIYNDIMYYPENKKDIEKFERIQKFSEIDFFQKSVNT